MIQDEAKRWFCEAAMRDQDFLAKRFFPLLETRLGRAARERDQANREGSLADIKYRQGCLDGLSEVTVIILGMMASEQAGKPNGQGSLSRMLARLGGHPAEAPTGPG